MIKLRITNKVRKTGFFALTLWAAFSFRAPLPPAAGSGLASGFRITGKITGSKEGMKVYLNYADIPQNTAQDSTLLHNGRFLFAGKTLSPRYYSIVFKDTSKERGDFEYKNISLFVENADITVEAPYDSLRSVLDGWYGKGTSSALMIKGSASEDFYQKYNKQKEPLDKQHSDLFNDYIKFLNPDSGAVKQPRTVGMALCRRMDIVDSTRKVFVMDFIKNNPPNEVVAYIAMQTLNTSNITTDDIDWMTQRFAAAKEKGFLVSKFLEDAPLTQKTAVGSSLVDFTMQDTSGNAHALSSYIGKGKYVLLECWASWCHPCRADIPHLKEVYALYHPYGFEVISVSLDDKRASWTKAIDQEKMEWMQLSDMQAFGGVLPKTYRIRGIPDCLLFDPEGKLVTRNMRGSWMDNRLIEMYGNRFPAQAGQ